MGSRCTYHRTQVNTPRQAQSDRPVLDLPTPEGWKAEFTPEAGASIPPKANDANFPLNYASHLSYERRL